MCTVLLPPGDNPIAVNKYIKHKRSIVQGSEKWGVMSSEVK